MIPVNLSRFRAPGLDGHDPSADSLDVMSTDDVALRENVSPRIHTFLIADIRGYTDFTARHGDEAAAALASTFATITRTSVERFGGTVPELRGDEALAVFGSPRQALRTAIEMQAAFGAHVEEDPSTPLHVGIGIDAGEAVPVESGFRGGALNTAARLCSQAQAGEILATQVVTHLARAVEGLTYVDRGLVSLKGLPDRVHVMEIHKAGGDLVPVEHRTTSRHHQPASRMPFEDLADSLGSRLSESIHLRVQDALSRLPEQALAHLPDDSVWSPGGEGHRALAPPPRTHGPSSNEVIIAALGIGLAAVIVIVVAIVIVILHG